MLHPVSGHDAPTVHTLRNVHDFSTLRLVASLLR